MAGIARVQAGNSGTIAVTQNTAPVSLTGVGVGHGLIVIPVNKGSGSACTVSSVSDGSNTYSQVSGARAVNGTQMIDLWICKNVGTGGSLTITPTFSASTGGPACVVVEVSGQDTVTFIDHVTPGNGSTASASIGPNTANTNPNEFVMAAIGANTNSTSTSPSFSTALTGQTNETFVDCTATGQHTGLNVWDGVESATTAETFTATIAAAVNWTGFVAAFLAAATIPNSGSQIFRNAVQRSLR